MNTRPQGIPLVPDKDARRVAAVRSLTRAALATGVAALERTTRAADYVRQTWEGDHVADMVLRAAVSPATLAGNAALAHVSVAFLESLVPMSAGADLLNRGIGLNFAGAASIRVPGIAIPTTDFVAEGAPIPAPLESTSAGPTLSPFKIAALASLTNEMMRSPNAEEMVRAVLIESAGPALDKAMFSANAATSAKPAGLLNGIAGLTPAAAGEKAQVIVDDLQTLAAAIAPVSGNSNIVLVASPDAAVALRLRLFTEEWPVLTSSQLAARTVIMIATNAIVSAVEGAPMVDASTQTAFVRDSTPMEIVTTPGVVATSVGSVYQTDETLLRLRWPIAWALRDARGLAWMTAVNW
jgi:hypothetical protein